MSQTEKPAYSLAIGTYDHVRALVSGSVQPVGSTLRIEQLSAPEIFARFPQERHWDIAEMSLGMYAAQVSRGETWLTAIPVFPSRAFRHSAIFVRRGGPVHRPEDLQGAGIGFPDWTHTAGIYARALLVHEYGVSPEGVTWVQGGLAKAGFTQRAHAALPPAWRHEPRQDKSLDAMLLDGEIDAIISAHTPPAATGPESGIVRLFADSVPVEKAYYERTGIFPIMHVIAIRRDVAEASPALAGALMNAFEAAKRESMARLTDSMVSQYPLPWTAQRASEARALFGDDWWPYGVRGNRHTLQAFLGYAHEQGVTTRRLAPEELFFEKVLDS
jgi:4,5-dihydroxyphthalate decarboxylase